MFCENCGFNLSEEAKFCPQCGYKVLPSIRRQIQQNTPDKIVNTDNARTDLKPGLTSKIIKSKTSQHSKIINFQNKSIEEIANTELKETTCLEFSLIGMISLVIGEFICYYTEGNFLFACFIALILSVIVMPLYSFIKSCIFKSYNREIVEARAEIDRIEENNGNKDELFRWRMARIERVLSSNNLKLTDSDFVWHTQRVCWGCGKLHEKPPVPYVYTIEYTDSYRKGAFRKIKTYKKSAKIMICPDCKKRLKPSNGYFSGIGTTKWSFEKIPDIVRFYNNVEKLAHVHFSVDSPLHCIADGRL